MNNIEDTFNILSSSLVCESKHGGYYYFYVDKLFKNVGIDNIGSIKTTGKIYEIIVNKEHNGQLFTDWLDQLKHENAFYAYVRSCDIYAEHILYTHPNPGEYWKWKL